MWIVIAFKNILHLHMHVLHACCVVLRNTIYVSNWNTYMTQVSTLQFPIYPHNKDNTILNTSKLATHRYTIPLHNNNQYYISHSTDNHRILTTIK